MNHFIQFGEAERQVFEKMLGAMAEFKQVFGRGLDPGFVAELHVASKLGLKLVSQVNMPDYDAVGQDERKYQIKYRDIKAQSVDLKSFKFDELVLVNLDQDYQLVGMWRLTAVHAQTIFVHREKFRKYQATQVRIKAVAERIV